jgi:hypothetical protein
MNLFQYTLVPCHLLSILILASISYAQQSFYLVSHFPQTQANNVPGATTIKLKFNQPLAAGLLPSNTLIVIGDVFGYYNGTFSFENENCTLCFTPEKPFSAGENIQVTLNRTLMSNNGQILGNPFSFSFHIATRISQLQFHLLKTIPLTNLPDPIQLASYDLNCDGMPDFIVGANNDPANPKPARIAFLWNISIGQYILEERIVGVSTCCFILAPFDSDQYPDLIALDYFGAAVQFLKGQGNAFADYRTLFVWQAPIWGEMSDYDGDGDFDFAIASISTRINRGLSIFTNDGNAHFKNTTILQDSVPTRFVAWGNLNADGVLDLIASSIFSRSDELTVYLADGLGIFKTPISHQLEDYTTYILLRDFDADKDLDAVIAQPFFRTQSNHTLRGRLEVLLNNGKGIFSSHQTLLPQGSAPTFLDCRDFDGDGDMDAACTNSGINVADSSVTIFLNDGVGNFSRGPTVKVGKSPTGLRFVDINQDSRLDLAVVTVDPPALHLFLADSLTFGIDDEPIPTMFRLSLKINPNPFRDVVTIHLQAPINAAGEIFIFDVLGRKVFSAPVQIRSEKETILWNGRDSSNRLAPSGIYLAKLTVGAESTSKKLLLLR